MHSNPPVELIRGLGVSRLSFNETAALLEAWAVQDDRCRYFACVNAHSAEMANRDKEFKRSLLSADLLVADGYGVILASKILGAGIKERSTGPDLFIEVSRRLNDQGERSVFYLGGSPATLDAIAERHAVEFPRLRIAGTHAPPYQTTFTDSEMSRMIDIVNEAAPDVLWIGLGAPKQEKWIYRNRSRLQVALCGPVGAMFDYFAGNVKMPPRWVEQAGLHWAFRLAQQPKRLWRRNLDSPLFLGRVLLERLGGCGHARRGPG